MGKVILDMSMSLDGLIGGLNHEDVGLYRWYFAPSGGSQKVIDELVESLGAIIMGRRTYAVGDEQGDSRTLPIQRSTSCSPIICLKSCQQAQPDLFL